LFVVIYLPGARELPLAYLALIQLASIFFISNLISYGQYHTVLSTRRPIHFRGFRHSSLEHLLCWVNPTVFGSTPPITEALQLTPLSVF
jgi:hypothetical protein